MDGLSRFFARYIRMKNMFRRTCFFTRSHFSGGTAFLFGSRTIDMNSPAELAFCANQNIAVGADHDHARASH